MAFIPFDKHKKRQGNGNAVNFDTAGDTLVFIILKSSWTPDRVTPEFISDLTPGTHEGAGYTRPTLASKTWTLNGSNEYVFDCADVSIAQNAAGFTQGRYVALAKSTGVDSTSPVIAYEDMGSDKSIVGGPLDLQSPNGLFKT